MDATWGSLSYLNIEMAASNGKRKAIVSLTYDGTQLCHSETVLPHLDAFDLKATFYADPLPLLESLPIWKVAVKRGHEVANGCLIGSVDGSGDLDSWTPEMVGDDVDETDRMLAELFPGQSVYSFGYPWVTGGAYGISYLRRIIEERHSVCRSGEQGTNDLEDVDLSYLKCVPMDDASASQMIEVVRSSVRNGEWIILAFEGIGSGEPSIDASAHLGLCSWIADNRELFEVLTVSEAAERAQGGSKQSLRLL